MAFLFLGVTGSAIFLINANKIKSEPPLTEETGIVRAIRTLYPGEWGVPHPAGLTISLHLNQIFTIDKTLLDQPPLTTRVSAITLYEDGLGEVELPVVPGNPVNITYDDRSRSLFLIQAQGTELVRINCSADGVPEPRSAEVIDISQLGLSSARGMDVDSVSGKLYILDAASLEIAIVDPANPHELVPKISVAFIGTNDLLGLSVHPINHNIFLASPGEKRLFEIDFDHSTIRIYDLSNLDLADQQGFDLAPSADRTDPVETIHLYIADSRLTDSGETIEGPSGEIYGSIVEAEILVPVESSDIPENKGGGETGKNAIATPAAAGWQSYPPPSAVPVTEQVVAAIEVPRDFPTIQEAVDHAVDGDLVLVAPGTYFENLRISGKTISLASWFLTSGEADYIQQTIIDGSGNNVIDVDPSAGQETTITGFTIRNGSDGIKAAAQLNILNNVFTGNQDGIDYESGGGLCKENVFENNKDDGIDLDGATGVTIEGNIIRNNLDDGIEIRLHAYSGPVLSIVITRNVISGNGEDGVQIIDHPGDSDRIFHIERNLIQDNVMAGLGMMDNGETKEDFRGASIPDRILLLNNTFEKNDHILAGGANLIALNNIFTGANRIGLKNVDGASIAAYNLFWNNGIDFENSNVDPGSTIQADPHLVNAVPASDSPVIDAGTAFFTWNNAIVLDMDASEYAGPAPDIGFFEKYTQSLVFIANSVRE